METCTRYCRMPCRDGQDIERHHVDASITFRDKQQKLARIVELLSRHDRIRECVSFDPDVPQVNMIHGYLCHSKQECMNAIETVEKQSGIRVLSRLRDVQESDPAYKEGYDVNLNCPSVNPMGLLKMQYSFKDGRHLFLNSKQVKN